MARRSRAAPKPPAKGTCWRARYPNVRGELRICEVVGIREIRGAMPEPRVMVLTYGGRRSWCELRGFLSRYEPHTEQPARLYRQPRLSGIS